MLRYSLRKQRATEACAVHQKGSPCPLKGLRTRKGLIGRWRLCPRQLFQRQEARDFSRERLHKDLTYGYELTGFEILEDSVIWEITTYERPIKQNDCIRGMDACYLMFKDGIIVEAARQIDYKLMYDKNSISEDDYEAYSNSYIDISDIPLV